VTTDPTQLLRAWLRALGAWRLLIAVLTVLTLLLVGPRLATAPEPHLDQLILDRLHNLIPDGPGTVLLRIYQLSGVHVTSILVLAVLIFLALKRFWADLICLVLGTGGILLVVDRLFKPLVDRPRPSGSLLAEIQGRSFPSGHAAGSVVFYFLTCSLLAAHYPRLRRPLFVVSSIWVSLIWLSTLYARAHWLSDIAAGAALGYVWLSFCLAGYSVWDQHQKRRSTATSSLPPIHG
jgi:membrane-associated phospholipid phosphatase